MLVSCELHVAVRRSDSLSKLALFLVIFAGTELFTGNVMYLTTGVMHRTVTWRGMFRNLATVYLGNFIGCVLFALFAIYLTDITSNDDAFWSKLLLKKVHDYNWGQYLLRGVFCNMMVCMGCFFSMSAESIEGKVISMWWPIMAFAFSGHEHSIANMFFISAAYM
jgi:formate/nitrite transporter